MFYLYEKIRVAARSGALDRIVYARSHCARSRGVRLSACNHSGIPRRRHEAMAARATCETRSTWSALDRCICARLLLPMFERRHALLVVALDRRCSAIERTNRGFTHLSSILPFKPRLHNKDLQHNKTLNIN
jgi:hypothetical protein